MKERCFTRITVVLLLLLSIPWLLPVYAMLTTSVKTQAEVAGQHYLQLPETLNWSNYAVAFKL
jgi:ABC-type glycerol-3-phosphate transport system permease component